MIQPTVQCLKKNNYNQAVKNIPYSAFAPITCRLTRFQAFSDRPTYCFVGKEKQQISISHLGTIGNAIFPRPLPKNQNYQALQKHMYQKQHSQQGKLESVKINYKLQYELLSAMISCSICWASLFISASDSGAWRLHR